MKKAINKNLLYLIIIVIFETIFLKTIMYSVLPDKYFYDSNHIFAVMNGSLITDKGYSFAADIFNSLNFFHLNSIQQWGYVISAVYINVLIIFLIYKRKVSLFQSLFIIASTGLLNFYVFCLSKDIIQFTYFLFVYLIINFKKLNNFSKLILSCLIFIHEALNFRIYYAIMALLMISLYYIYLFFIKNKSLNKKSAFKIIILILFVFFAEVFLFQLISIDNYQSILNARNVVNSQRSNDIAANTIILDLLGKNNNYLIFVCNYIINLFRLMFPLELLTKGLLPSIFIIFQLYITYNLLKICKRINSNNILLVILVFSFLLVSVIFEPDFGSFTRHESALLLFLIDISIINEKKEGKNSEKS